MGSDRGASFYCPPGRRGHPGPTSTACEGWKLPQKTRTSARSGVDGEPLEVVLHEGGALAGLAAAGLRAHGGGQAEQFREEVVDGIGAVIRRARLRQGFFRMVEREAERAGHGEAPGDADGAQRVEPVGVLHDLRLGGVRGYVPRPAVRGVRGAMPAE